MDMQSRTSHHETIAEQIAALEHFAFIGLFELELDPEEFVVYCIKAEDTWRTLIEALLPDMDWQQPCAGRDTPTLCGIIDDANEFFSLDFPEIIDLLEQPMAKGKVKCLVLEAERIAVYNINPSSHESEIMQPHYLH